MELDINNYTVKFVAIIVAIFLVVYGLYAAINYYVSSKIQSFISVQVEPGESSPLPFPLNSIIVDITNNDSKIHSFVPEIEFVNSRGKVLYSKTFPSLVLGPKETAQEKIGGDIWSFFKAPPDLSNTRIEIKIKRTNNLFQEVFH